MQIYQKFIDNQKNKVKCIPMFSPKRTSPPAPPRKGGGKGERMPKPRGSSSEQTFLENANQILVFFY